LSRPWNQRSVSDCLYELRIPPDAILMIHSNVAWLGRPAYGSISETLMNGLKHFQDVTLIFPAFTYSYARGEEFDPLRPPKHMGVLTDLAFHRGYLRSIDPMFSMIASGPNARRLLENPPPRSFGPGSTFDRLMCDSAYLVAINLDAGSTLLHNIERRANVRYRYDKVFHGASRIRGSTEFHSWTSYVRDLHDPGTVPSFDRLTADLISQGLWRRVSLGNGFLASIALTDYEAFIMEKLVKDPYYLIAKGNNKSAT
jgi:aminoglycoside 3-N-acetyltransferase